MIRIQFLLPSPKAGEISLQTKEVALPLIASGLAQRIAEPEPLSPAVINWRVENDTHSGVLYLRGTCQRGGEKLAFGGDPVVLKGKVFFQHSCAGVTPPERIPEKVIAEFTRRKREAQ